MSYLLGNFLFNVPIQLKSAPFGVDVHHGYNVWSAHFLVSDQTDNVGPKVTLGFVMMISDKAPYYEKGDEVILYRGPRCIGVGLVFDPSAPYSKLIHGKESPIEGRGIFARQDFKKGDILRGVESKTPSRGFNYSCNPNIVVMPRSEALPGERPLPKRLLRDVAAGEELLVPLPYPEFQCKCLSCGGSYVPKPREKVLHNSTFNFGGSYVLGT